MLENLKSWVSPSPAHSHTYNILRSEFDPHLLLIFVCISRLCFLIVCMILVSSFDPFGESGRCVTFMPWVADSSDPHLGSRSPVGGSEEEIRTGHTAAGRRESNPQREAPELPA